MAPEASDLAPLVTGASAAVKAPKAKRAKQDHVVKTPVWGRPHETTRFCRHPCCGRSGPGTVTVPAGAVIPIITACYDGQGGSKKYAKALADDTKAAVYICRCHLSPEYKPGASVDPKHILRHKDDPVVMGSIPGHNAQGDKRWERIQPRSSPAPRRTTYRANPVIPSADKILIERLSKKVTRQAATIRKLELELEKARGEPRADAAK
eukprot:CAMPEP_0182922560 /NCGR_PEP_ID=MMETSP0105_2-20130417/4877_1 /TAXON_ID=81532 ORGANISM="Acanthoeca-like sp., Strain 10tr" /NCGR_SAMPLE_ID=MMETSP0105_2 /ASSEMBLY_ACC=CAM_ASM_000205 /LENGTH=207 /DNA_ID=CAMNT_0025060191 /DNA_START=182 /DNA_END=805 /DNA_ORIENTATION=-